MSDAREATERAARELFAEVRHAPSKWQVLRAADMLEAFAATRPAAEPAGVSEAFVDADADSYTDVTGTVWTRPTAWAYFAACRALHAAEARALAAEAALAEERERLARVLEQIDAAITDLQEFRTYSAEAHLQDAKARSRSNREDPAALIAAKSAEPAFKAMGERLDANINWPRYLTAQEVRPTGVSAWIVRLLPSGQEIIVGDEDWQAARSTITAEGADTGEAGNG